MDRLTDSMPVADRPDELSQRFARDGYLYFRGLIPREDVLDVRADVLGAVDEAGWLEPGAPRDEARPQLEACAAEPSDEYMPMYAKVQAVESFHRLAHHPAVTAVLGPLVGGDLLVHPRKIARVNVPSPEISYGVTPPHQDYRYIQGTTDVITAWVPFGTYPVGHGGLKILPGSQRLGLLRAVPVPRMGGIGVEIADDAPGWSTVDYAAGDLVMFHSFTVHAGTPNASSSIRISGDFRYQSTRDPIVPETLNPHYDTNMRLGWPELTRTWASRDWIAVPEGVRTKPYEDGMADLRPPAPRLVVVDAVSTH